MHISKAFAYYLIYICILMIIHNYTYIYMSKMLSNLIIIYSFC